jgi:hypothetical protein
LRRSCGRTKAEEENVLRKLKVAAAEALAVGSVLLLLASPVGAASDTACDKLRAISAKLGCPGSGHEACPGIANALSKTGCGLNTSNWILEDNICVTAYESFVGLNPAFDSATIAALTAGTLFLEVQGSTWKAVFEGVDRFGITYFAYGPTIQGSLVTGPGTLDCSQPKGPNGIFVDLVAYIFS